MWPPVSFLLVAEAEERVSEPGRLVSGLHAFRGAKWYFTIIALLNVGSQDSLDLSGRFEAKLVSLKWFF